MARRIRGYLNPEARFIVLRDQDSAPDCRVVKEELVRRVRESGRAEHAAVRIACRELEAFYLADLAAVGQALGLPDLACKQHKQKFRAPDYLGSPGRELHLLTKGRYQKVGSSRQIARYLDLDNERSASFRNFSGLSAEWSPSFWRSEQTGYRSAHPLQSQLPPRQFDPITL